MACKRAFFVLVITGACGGTESSGPQEPIEIIGRDWTVPPGTETYHCIGIQVDRDIYVSEFRTTNPIGEHHAVLTVADQLGGLGGTRLGEYECDVLTLDLEMLFASGVGTDKLAMPEGVALLVEAGQYLHLNLHLYNTSDAPITAHSGIIATPIDPVDENHLAEMVFAGTTNINVPPGETMTIGGGCTFSREAKIFSYWPHMHQYAHHQKVTLTSGGTQRVIHDSAFDFNEQLNYGLSPMLSIKAGDSIHTDCTYTNTNTQVLRFGDSSNTEMCFTGLYRYPKQAYSLFECTEGSP